MRRISILIVGLLFTCTAAAQRRGPLFELEIPEANIKLTENQSVQLLHSFVNKLAVRLFRTPQQINYGSIALKINGESANIIMTSRSDSGGVICDLDLNLRAGFRLLPGRNSVEATAVDFYSRRYHTSFLIDIRSEGFTGTGIRTESRVADPAAALPQIRLSRPAGAVSAAQRRVLFEGSVVYPDRTWTLSIAGRNVAMPAADSAGAERDIVRDNEFPFRYELDVPDDAKDIRVEVETPRGNRAALLVPVIAGNTLDGGEVSDKFAVVVGISRYRNAGPGFPNLQYARSDAVAFRDFLLSDKGGRFRASNVLTLLDENATILNVRTALFTFLARARENDLVVIYFAGHGAPDPNNPSDLYFIVHDTDAGNMGATALPMWQLRDLFSRTLKTRRVVTFADACHSGGIGADVERPHNLINQYVFKYASADGRAIITASDIGESSLESDAWGGGHGVFTYYLLQAFQGGADADGDGSVTAGELFEFVRAAVSRETSGRQNPVAVPGIIYNQPLFNLTSN